MYCKYCGTHLYREITFRNIFKWNYYVHEKCEEIVKMYRDFIVVPILSKLLKVGFLFPERYETSDEEYLFFHYGEELFHRIESDIEWSVVLFDWDWLATDTLSLVMNLADTSLLVLSVFNENLH